ncbi:hypothetical protein WKW79_11775 [Variovorax robiniae]|uniref:Uncharacterized protein n=1 Tax=Variovorax robiniae TaxID=1836199 RepID=A0ABU8X643_9BURK
MALRNFLQPAARTLAALALMAAFASGAQAQATADEFPAAAVRFLDNELPQMDNAVKERDRDYFEQAMGRMIEFSGVWGFKTAANPELARYSMCTDAVNEFVIVGLCRVMPKGSECEPGLAAKFDGNLQRCREAATKR